MLAQQSKQVNLTIGQAYIVVFLLEFGLIHSDDLYRFDGRSLFGLVRRGLVDKNVSPDGVDYDLSDKGYEIFAPGAAPATPSPMVLPGFENLSSVPAPVSPDAPVHEDTRPVMPIFITNDRYITAFDLRARGYEGPIVRVRGGEYALEIAIRRFRAGLPMLFNVRYV